ncbi:MAG: CHAT domain-containing protein [Armatimonadetes bacterium]|nr:CHAT domain-containing protein [Armatimonadota bacterium]
MLEALSWERSALVEYVSIPVYYFKATGKKERWGDSRYFAFVLPSVRGPGGPPEAAIRPALLDLGEASTVNESVKEFRLEVARALRLFKSGIVDEAAAEKHLAERGRRLYDLVVSPIKQALGERTTLFLSPDADLNLIPFGALQDETGRYLAENCRLHYLSCGRDLLRFEGQEENSGETVILANPDLDMPAPDRLARQKALPGTETRVLMQGASRSRDLTVSRWPPLPGTRLEAESIKKTLRGEKTREYLGRSALEEVLKKLRSPRRLHLATHGFFVEDQDKSSFLESGIRTARSFPTASRPIKIENPLLRSGLVLAGANRLGKENLPEGCEDGILTALEISGIPLRGTDLVVLSACETGLGRIHRGEGVFGLRRAFQLAGAKTVVMSLWSVPGKETQELMANFYERIEKGEGKAAALREASLAMMKARREKHGAAHPFFWAPFICAGEP